MLKKKSSSSEKKRKHSQSEERHDNAKRRSADSNAQQEPKDELADPDLDRIGSDIEDGGLDLSLQFKPITAFVSDRQEMLEQCFRVLGDKKLRKMLPDELKDCSLEEMKKLCREQLEPITDANLLQILSGEEMTCGNGDKNAEESMENQQDNIVDSTSCVKEAAKTEDPKQEGVSGEESDVLSINADTYDSDIEGPKEEHAAKAADGGGAKAADSNRKDADQAVNADPAVKPDRANPEPPAGSKPTAAKKDIQSDIDKSVSEILAFSPASNKEAVEATAPPQPVDVSSPVQSGSVSGRATAASQPSIQQLELLELEMRARAIKALMKASDGKKPVVTKTV